MVRDPNTGEITARPGTAADGTADQPTPGEPPRSGEPQLRLERTPDGRVVLAVPCTSSSKPPAHHQREHRHGELETSFSPAKQQRNTDQARTWTRISTE